MNITINSATNIKKVLEMNDEDIDTSESQPWTKEEWEDSLIMIPAKKQIITIRLDEDIIKWFKGNVTKGYQTYINGVLRTYVEKQKEKVQKKSKSKIKA